MFELNHHAYCIIGTSSAALEVRTTLEKKHKIKSTGNPDFFDRTYESFTISDAREVKALAESRPVTSGGRKIFLLCMNGITTEAQNALLKLLEEPAEYANFFLVIPSAHLLLPTVKSRVRVIDMHDEAQASPLEKFAKTLVAAPTSKRLDLVKTFMDEITKEKRPKQDAVDLVSSLEQIIHERAGGTAAGLKKNANALEAVMLTRKYSTDRAPSLKTLLEYLSMVV